MRALPGGPSLISGLLFFSAIAGVPAAHAQCDLANPSFEILGSSGSVFGGWNQFGSVGPSTDAFHGGRSARVSGPNTGNWDVSAFWQRLDSAPGDRWTASVSAKHLSAKPLTGGARAILNIEWRNSGGGLISYESFTVADAATPVDEIVRVTFVSGPAPAGTVATHLLLGVLQGPGDPSPDVIYDLVTFVEEGPPSLEDRQWSDFPGGRTLSFSGRTWRVKGPGFYGPGPNLFSDATSSAWVDLDGRLHLAVRKSGSSWYSSEVVVEEALGYGDYIFTTIGRLDLLDPQVVLGLFLWQYGPCYDTAYLWWNPYNEIDIEFSRWGNPGIDVGQFVAQPYDWYGNRERFAATFSPGEITSHAFRWLPDRVEFRSWRGGPDDESPGTLIHSWTYDGPHIPRPEIPRVHVNLWKLGGTPATNQEVVLDAFTFLPAGSVVAAPETPAPPRRDHLLAAWPNPFTPATRLRFVLEAAGPAGITVHDVSGRLVRTLLSESLEAGTHETGWDGLDQDGIAVPSGVYLLRLRTARAIETRQLIRLR